VWLFTKQTVWLAIRKSTEFYFVSAGTAGRWRTI
jgi:hypothetical protein